MSNNAPDYGNNIVFLPKENDKIAVLEKKLKIANEALSDIESNRFSYIDEQNCVNTKVATQKELRILAREALAKIKE